MTVHGTKVFSRIILWWGGFSYPLLNPCDVVCCRLCLLVCPDLDIETYHVTKLHWRHNGHDGVSNHQPHDCLLNRLFRRKDQRKRQSSASLTFVRGIHRGPVNSPRKGPVTRKMFLFDDVIMIASFHWNLVGCIPSGYVLRYPRSTLDVVALLVSAVCFYGNHPGSNSKNCTALFSIERIVIALRMGAGVQWGPVVSPCLTSVWFTIFLRLLLGLFSKLLADLPGQLVLIISLLMLRCSPLSLYWLIISGVSFLHMLLVSVVSFFIINSFFLLHQRFFFPAILLSSRWVCIIFLLNIDGLAQDSSNSRMLAMELLQSCAKPSTCGLSVWILFYLVGCCMVWPLVVPGWFC